MGVAPSPGNRRDPAGGLLQHGHDIDDHRLDRTGTSAAGPAGTTGTTGKKTSSASSDEIKKWQTQLNAVGCDAGPVDGIDGGETEAAIRGFQSASGLTVDGTMGPQTEAALNAAVTAGKKVCTYTPPSSTASTTTTASPASSTTPGTSSGAPGECPGPQCYAYSISPSSGAAGTTITVKSVSGACTTMGVIALNPASPPAPSIATGTLSAQGASQYSGTITVPPGTKPGQYYVNSWLTGAMMTAGICQATFTVTG